MKIMYAKDIPILNTKVVSINDILTNKYDIKNIGLDREIIINNKSVLLNDTINPLSYVDNYIVQNSLCINPEYLENNKEEINRLLINFINNYSGSLAIKSTKLINDKVINAIATNPNITEIQLGSRNDIYRLKESDYKVLKNGTIKSIITYGVEEELDFNFDDIIHYNVNRNLISYYTYDVLMSMNEQSELYVFKPLTDDEIKYFNILKGVTICFDYEDYENIFDSIEKLEINDCNFKYRVNIHNNDKESLNLELLHRNKLSSKIEIEFGLTSMSIDEYLNYEKFLYELIKPAVELSPYEKFLYAYNITKHYKQYNYLLNLV